MSHLWFQLREPTTKLNMFHGRWRTQAVCPLQCPHGTTYQECRSACPVKTCDNQDTYQRQTLLCMWVEFPPVAGSISVPSGKNLVWRVAFQILVLPQWSKIIPPVCISTNKTHLRSTKARMTRNVCQQIVHQAAQAWQPPLATISQLLNYSRCSPRPLLKLCSSQLLQLVPGIVCPCCLRLCLRGERKCPSLYLL